MCDSNSVLDNFVLEVGFHNYYIITSKKNDCNFAIENIGLEAKEGILRECRRVLQNHDTNELYTCLCCLRILTRDEVLRKNITSQFFLSQLFEIAFEFNSDLQSPKINVEALKSLSNIVFKEPCSIDQLKVMGLIKKLIESVESPSAILDKERLLLCLKLLFIVTAMDSSSREELIKSNALQTFMKFLDIKRLDITSEVATETLKTVYNILYSTKDGDVTKELDDDIQKLVVMLRHILQDSLLDQFNNYALISPDVVVIIFSLSQVVNVLNIIPKRSYKYLLDDTSGEHSVGNLAKDSVSDNKVNEMSSIEVLIAFLHSQLKLVLPYLGKDVTRLPEDGDSIRNHLCKLLTHPVQIVGESAALFIFVLCKENIGRAVKYTGFGNFAGFLARHALLGKPSKAIRQSKCNAMSDDEYSDTSTESETEEYKQLKEDVNPVTGRWEVPQPNPMENMSEEQKEYLAMDLVQKIDRLERSGLIQPGTIGEDGRVRPVQHILELIQTKDEDQKSDESAS
ncbi:Synembryn-A [Schistosoma japonicum]|nr:Synembryn-A [Schistosoma japonicum]KAH8876323.1 Synembryn-A [Schistosoma japonicum]